MTGRALFGSVAALVSLLATAPAFGFCRTTTCDPEDPAARCTMNGICVTSGIPLAWRSSCVTVGIQEAASPKNGLTFDDVAPVVKQAFGAWMAADCGSGHPSIDVEMIGPVQCGVSEYNSNAANANIVLFHDDDWPFTGAANAVGLTTVRFDTETGDLWDADIELNGYSVTLSVGDPITGDDLLSVLTHEAGHFLGLSHSSDPTASMKPVYDPVHDGATFRSLSKDDVAGICAIYPPERIPGTSSCDNRHGFSAQCAADQPRAHESKGCSLNTRAPAAASTTPAGYMALFVAGIGLVLRARLARRRFIV